MELRSERVSRCVSSELTIVWSLYAIVAVEILVTYARVPARQLYAVSGSGVEAAFSRAFVFVDFPAALVGIVTLVFCLDRLAGWMRVLGALGIVLCAAVFWPGIVDPHDLDARPVNAIAAVGVVVALAVAWRSGVLRLTRLERRPGDPIRLLIATVAVLLALPWIAADLGVSFAGVPVLGTLYQTTELRSQPGVAGLHPAVHHGHHHGMDGTLLVFTALALSRLAPLVRSRPLRSLFGALLALMLCYGAGNVANDFWLEQVVKRGWTTWEIPGVEVPTLSVAWGVIVFAAVVVWLVASGLAARRRFSD